MRLETTDGKTCKEIEEQDRWKKIARRKQRVEQQEIPEHLKPWVDKLEMRELGHG